MKEFQISKTASLKVSHSVGVDIEVSVSTRVPFPSSIGCNGIGTHCTLMAKDSCHSKLAEAENVGNSYLH